MGKIFIPDFQKELLSENEAIKIAVNQLLEAEPDILTRKPGPD